MALFKTLKRAFGFGDSEVEDNGHEGIDARVKPLRKPDADEVADGENIAGRDASPGQNGADDAGSGTDAVDLQEQSVVPAAIFETVVKIFNESLPDFIRQTAGRELLFWMI